MEDLRKKKRVDYREQIVINRIIKAPGTSLSEGGFFASTGYRFTTGAILNIDIPLNRNTMTAKAQVRHTLDDIGFGASFQDLTLEQRDMLTEYVNSRISEVADITRKRILHIDADPLKRRLYKGKLVSDGYIVFEASTGPEALEIMGQKEMDLVLMDIYFDGSDGLDIISTIRGNPKWKHLPVIVLASKNVLYDMKRARENGAIEFLQKMTTTPVALSGIIRKHMPQTLGRQTAL
jgi:CheY-like chemotaxis protein